MDVLSEQYAVAARPVAVGVVTLVHHIIGHAATKERAEVRVKQPCSTWYRPTNSLACSKRMSVSGFRQTWSS